MKIKITSDSTCDLSRELLAQYDIDIMPLAVFKGGESFFDGVDISPKEIFAHVAGGGELCSTAARGPEEYREAFSRWQQGYDALVHISLGSGFSSSYQNACMAAEELEHVYVVDSQNLSTGQGLVVLSACDMAKSCTDVAAMVEELRELTTRVDASFLLDQLGYMVKGGRCSGVAALSANILQLKPCIEVHEGKMRVCKKYQGSYTRCIKKYAQDRLEKAPMEKARVFVTHTPVEEVSRLAAKQVVLDKNHFEQILETDAGCTVSCHCGPGTLGVLFIREKAE